MPVEDPAAFSGEQLGDLLAVGRRRHGKRAVFVKTAVGQAYVGQWGL